MTWQLALVLLFFVWTPLCVWWGYSVAKEPNARRYWKLRWLMTRNLPETWEQVERIAGVGCWASWEDFDAMVDDIKPAKKGGSDARSR